MADLQKRLTVSHGVGLAVSTLIGSGLLGLPGLAIQAGGPKGAAAGWLTAGLLSIPLVVLFMRLAADARHAGGVARSVERAFGPTAGGAATVMLAATFALCIPIGTWMGSSYVQRILALPPAAVPLVAVAVLAGCTAVNVAGVKPSAALNTTSVVGLVCLVLVLALANPSDVASGAATFARLFDGHGELSFGTVWSVSAILFWAFLGWENLSFGSEEIVDRPGVVERIFLAGFVAVGAIYALLALVSVGASNRGADITGVTGLLALVEGRASLPIKALITVVVVANVNAWVFAASRLVFAAGRDGIFPAAVGRVASNGVPRVSLLALLFAYVGLTATLATGALPLTTGLAIANQNFIVLYLAAAIAFLRIFPGPMSLAVTGAAVAACVFLLSGFGAWLAVPAGLAAGGAWLARRGAGRRARGEPFASVQ